MSVLFCFGHVPKGKWFIMNAVIQHCNTSYEIKFHETRTDLASFTYHSVNLINQHNIEVILKTVIKKC